MWLGVGEKRPYKKDVYHPGNWRKRVGFGTGTLGDMGCHIFSTPIRAVNLYLPTEITSYGPGAVHGNWPIDATLKFVFPGTPLTAGKTLDFWWYDGATRPPAAVVDAVGGALPGSGAALLGTEGAILLPHIGAPTLHPAERFAGRAIPAPPARNHYHEFLDAVLAGPGAVCSAGFDYASLVTEAVLLGSVAEHYPGETLTYEPAAMRITNRRGPNRLLTRKFRKKYLLARL
jgi:hypothetical protein